MERDFTIELDEDLRREIEGLVVRRVRMAVEGARGRDEDLEAWATMLEGHTPPNANPRWTESCIIEDPLTREHHLALLASMMESLRQPPFWLVEAVEPEDIENASVVEYWLNSRAQQAQLPKYLYSLAYNALRDPIAILYVGWKQCVKKERVTMYKAPQTGALLHAADRQEGVVYEPAPMLMEALQHEGPEFRVPDLADFYLYPANAQDVESALGVGERIFLTREELLQGITDFGYDAEAVRDLIRMPPTHQTEYGWRSVRDERQGVTSSHSHLDGYYECFLWFGRMPLMLDDEGDDRIPSEYQGQDFTWMICPDHQIVFKFALSPYKERPYIPFRVMPIPNRLQGECLPGLLQPLQEEATANIRFVIDSMNLAVTPAIKAPEEWQREYGRYQIYPGAVLPYKKAPEEIMPMEWDKSGIPAGMEMQQWIEMRAREIVSAQGFGQLPTKVRKAAEIDFASQGVNQKFELFVENFNQGMELVAVHLIALYLAHMEPGGETVLKGMQALTVTQNDLRRRYRYIPHANTQSSSPQGRLQRTVQIVQFVRSSPLYQIKLQQGDFSMEYQLMRRGLEAMGERDIESLIGQEPSPPPSPQAVVQQAAMQGDPRAQAMAAHMQRGDMGLPAAAMGGPSPGAPGGAINVSSGAQPITGIGGLMPQPPAQMRGASHSGGPNGAKRRGPG